MNENHVIKVLRETYAFILISCMAEFEECDIKDFDTVSIKFLSAFTDYFCCVLEERSKEYEN